MKPAPDRFLSARRGAHHPGDDHVLAAPPPVAPARAAPAHLGSCADGGAGWTEADEEWLDADGEGDLPRWDDSAPAVQPEPQAARWAVPLPPLPHWAEPAPEVLPAAVPAPRERDAVAAAHEQFWQEEAQATSARSAGMSPIEVLLPTAALLAPAHRRPRPHPLTPR